MARWAVLKYGGTSVSTRTRWEHIAARVRELQETHRVCIVISAMAGHTNRLDQLLEEALDGQPADAPSLLADCHTLAREVGVSSENWSTARAEMEHLQQTLDGVRLTREASPRLRAAGARSKFGHPVAHLEALADATWQHPVRVVGLHSHVGSGILDPEAWKHTAQALLEATSQFPETSWICLGGGLGVPETPGQPPLDLDAVQRSLEPLKEALGGTQLRMEPGRYLVSEAGVLVAPVTQVREKDGVRYAGIATVMNSLIRPALYGSWHTIHNLSRLSEAPHANWQIVGPICESGDVLGRDRWIPDPQPGDCLLLENAGAYGHVMSSRYNLREPAQEMTI